MTGMESMLAAHVLVGPTNDSTAPRWTCSCGEFISFSGWTAAIAHAAHVAAELAAAGYGNVTEAEARGAARVRERVEALADEWEGWARTRSTARIDTFRDAAELLRAALAEAGGES